MPGSRSPHGGGPGTPGSSSSFLEDEEERTNIDPGPPISAPQGWGESSTADGHARRGAAGKRRAVDDDDFDTQNATVDIDEMTIDDPRRAIRAKTPGTEGQLTVVAGNDKGKSFDLTGRRLSIGRGIDNEIVLTDLAVSRQHLSIEYDGTHYYIRDLGSGNGTLVNDVEQREVYRLRDGDRVELGNTIFVVELPHLRGQPDLAQAGPAIGAPDDEEIATFAGSKQEVRKLVGAGAPAVAEQLAARATMPPTAARNFGPGVANGPAGGIAPKPGPGPMRVGQQSFATGAPTVAPPLSSPPHQPHHAPMASGPGSLPPLSSAPHQPHQSHQPHHAPMASGPGSLPPLSSPPGSPMPPSAGGPLSGRGPGTMPLSEPPQAAVGLSGRRPQSALADLLAEPIVPRSQPPEPAPPPTQPSGWASDADALPITMSAIATAEPARAHSPSTPVVYGDERLPMGPGTAPPQLQALPTFAPPPPLSSGRNKLLLTLGGAVLVIAIVGGVAVAMMGGGESKQAGEEDEPREETSAVATSAGKPDEPTKAASADGEKTAKTTDKPTLVAALSATTWGTDEAELHGTVDLPTGKEAEPAIELDIKPAPTEEPEEKTETETEEPEEKTEEPEEAPPTRQKPAPTRVSRSRPRPERVSRSRPRPVREPEPEEEEDTPVKAVAIKTGSADKAREKAAELYRQKKFDSAAATLRAAADKASGSEAGTLRSLASNYSKVGDQMGKGDRSLSDAPAAVSAYAEALRADRSAGQIHSGLLRTKLKLFAPKAAAAYMARGDYPGAKRMADIADSVGAGPKVSSVRSSLERKAAELVAAADRDASAGRADAARKKYKLAAGMVPKSSKSYKAAKVGLAKL